MKYFFNHFPNIPCLKCTVNSNFHLIRSKTLPTNDFELTIPDLYNWECTSRGRSRNPCRRGRQPSRGVPTYYFAKFCEKLHEIEKIFGRRGGHAGAPPLSLPLISVITGDNFLCKLSIEPQETFSSFLFYFCYCI